MTVKFDDADESEPEAVEEAPAETGGSEPDPQAVDSHLFHSHDLEGRYNHSHDGGDRPHTGHAEDGSPIFELPEAEPEPEGGCPNEPHLHVTLSRRVGMFLPFMDLGHQLVTGRGPWSLSSHCPSCGKAVEDRGGRRFRCDGDGCDARWEVPRDQVKTARSAALRGREGEEFVLPVEGDGQR